MASNVTPCVSHPSFLSHWAPNPSTERGDNLVLGTHPKEPKIIYPSGKFIVVRDVTNPTDVFVYRGHNAKTTVAKFSPNGFWVASADITGKVHYASSLPRETIGTRSHTDVDGIYSFWYSMVRLQTAPTSTCVGRTLSFVQERNTSNDTPQKTG